MTDEHQKKYIGEEGYFESIMESGQGWEIANNALSFGIDLATKRKTGDKVGLSKRASLLGSMVETEDEEKAKQGIISSELGLVETGLESYNDYKVKVKHWGRHVKKKPISKPRAFTIKVTEAYNKAKAALQIADSLSKAVFHFDLVDNIIKKPFFGDWDAILDTDKPWIELSDAFIDSAEELSEACEQLHEWEGEARNRFNARMQELTSAIEMGIEPCYQMQSALNLLGEIMENAFDLIVSIVDQVIGLLEIVLGECSLGPLGWLASTVTVVSWLYDAYNLYCDAEAMVNRVNGFLADFHGASQHIINALAQVNGLRASLSN